MWEDVIVNVGVGACEGVGVKVSVGVDVNVGVGVSVGVGVAMGVSVGVNVCVGVVTDGSAPMQSTQHGTPRTLSYSVAIFGADHLCKAAHARRGRRAEYVR